MKNLLLGLIVLASTQSLFAKDIASYRFGIREDQSTIKVMNAVLSDEKILRVEVTKASGLYPFFSDHVEESVVFEKELNDHTFMSLKYGVIALSNAEISKNLSAIVCMMMPDSVISNDHLSVARDYEINTGDFLSELELVMGPQGCWVSNKVHPKGGRHMMAAKLLKGQMKVIALELINE